MFPSVGELGNIFVRQTRKQILLSTTFSVLGKQENTDRKNNAFATINVFQSVQEINKITWISVHYLLVQFLDIANMTDSLNNDIGRKYWNQKLVNA